MPQHEHYSAREHQGSRGELALVVIALASESGKSDGGLIELALLVIVLASESGKSDGGLISIVSVDVGGIGSDGVIESWCSAWVFWCDC